MGIAVAQDATSPRGEIVAVAENGYARLAFTFPTPIKLKRTIANGVLILSPSSPVDVDVSGVARALPSYFVASRSDPSGSSFRLALARRLTVSILPAAERVFVDLLPDGWTGPLPELPAEVIAELARRAEESERAKRRAREGVSDLSSVPLTLRVGRYPTFSRIVFEWEDAVETELSRSGNKVKIRFNRPGEVDLTRLNVDPPPNVRGATMVTEDGRSEVEIDISVGADVRGFRENTSYVLDIANDDGLGLDEVEAVSNGQVSPDLPPVPTAEETIRLSGEGPRPDNPNLEPQASRAQDEIKMAETTPSSVPHLSGPAKSDLEISVVPLVIGETTFDAGKSTVAGDVRAAAMRQSPPVAAPRSETDANARPLRTAPPPQVEAQLAELTEIEPNKPAAEESPQALPAKMETGEALISIFDDPKDSKDAMAEVLTGSSKAKTIVETKIVGDTLRLVFPFGTPVAGAVFQRAQTLWMVYDTNEPLDVSSIKSNGDGRVQDVNVVVSGRLQILRVKLKRRYLATASPRPRNWVVSIGDLVLDPTMPVTLNRALRTDGRSKVVAQLPDNGHVHWISDDDIGDQLAVVTAFGPPRGLIKRQEFVEFAALPTAHGLVFKPMADDLAVRIAFSEVVVTRDRGLTVSSGKWPAFTPDERATGDNTRPGFIEFDKWRQGDAANYRYHVQRLSSEISRLDPEDRAGVRLELARLFLAHEFGAEALGEMRLAVEEDAEIENDSVFRAMRGVANLFMNRLDEAEADFAVHGLKQDPYSALWRGVVASRRGKWREAQLALDEGHESLDAYAPRHQALFRIAGGRAALMSNDLENATRHLDALPVADLDEFDRRQTLLMRALLAEALGDTDQALTFYRQVESDRWGKAAAEARYRRISLEVQLEFLPVDEAVEALETLSVSWRGDEVELAVMHRLARLLAGGKNYQRALEVMREAVRSQNGEEITRQIHEEMTGIFERLFLDEGVEDMRPLKALALYYEFRELTPVGRRGDEMIRKLVRRLIEVDLLGQAADLLNHQVEKRLTGAARAQVASDLALIYLMDHKPELALRTIRRTRQAVLPNALQQKRNTLEARALAELGRVEVAVELLTSMQGADVEELKSDALWRGKRWQAAAEQIEDMLGDAWQGDRAFTDNDRFNVMRAGISYALADDRAGLERLRRKFIAKMSASPDALKFDVVTKMTERRTVEFNTLAAEIAEIDTLTTFLENFRKRYGDAGEDPVGETSNADDGASAQGAQG